MLGPKDKNVVATDEEANETALTDEGLENQGLDQESVEERWNEDESDR